MGTFLYFGYASNLLAKRIHLQNHSAVRKNIAQLKNYRLDFTGTSTFWDGASATIVPHKGETVWGALWEIDNSNLADLDKQEGVNENIYFPKTVEVLLPEGQTVSCRLYQRTQTIPEGTKYPAGLPSLTYLTTIVNGAIESELPEDYITKLKNTPTNSNFNKQLAETLQLV